MDWSDLAYFAFVSAVVILMMRGCGGGMCGMGHRSRDNLAREQPTGKRRTPTEI